MVTSTYCFVFFGSCRVCIFFFKAEDGEQVLVRVLGLENCLRDRLAGLHPPRRCGDSTYTVVFAQGLALRKYDCIPVSFTPLTVPMLYPAEVSGGDDIIRKKSTYTRIHTKPEQTLSIQRHSTSISYMLSRH